MNPVVRMLLFLAAGGVLASLAFRLESRLFFASVLILAVACMLAGGYNYYLHARERWPFRTDR
jgi:hypothetical protein